MRLTAGEPIGLVDAVDHPVRRFLGAGRLHDRGEPVGDMHDLVAGYPGRDLARSTRDARGAQIAFSASEIRPPPITGAAPPQQCILGSVVAGEDDERVLDDV
jgi:hypothetical protein